MGQRAPTFFKLNFWWNFNWYEVVLCFFSKVQQMRNVLCGLDAYRVIQFLMKYFFVKSVKMGPLPHSWGNGPMGLGQGAHPRSLYQNWIFFCLKIIKQHFKVQIRKCNKKYYTHSFINNLENYILNSEKIYSWLKNSITDVKENICLT
jgi:hypothetical protein